MAKQINTRIQLKYDSYENWTKAPGMNLVLGAGEIGLCAIPSGSAEATTAPTVLFKVGDGTNAFSALKWGSALAADVHEWAKKDETAFIAWMNEKVVHPTIPDGFTISASAVNDDIVIATLTGGKNSITGNFTHAKKGPANGFAGSQVVTSINAAGESITIKVPKLTVDAYGHTNAVEEIAYEITIPDAVVNTITELSKGTGISIEDNGSDGNHNYTVALDVEGAKTALGLKALAYKDSLVKGDVGLGNVDNTADADKPVSTAQQEAINVALQAAKDYADQNDANDNTEYHIEYDSTNKQIKLVVGADATKMTIDATAFIKDGMVSNVEIKDGNLVITFNTDAGKDAIEVPLESLVDVYTGVDGTTITVNVSADDKISAEVKTGSLKDGHIAADAAIAKSKFAADVQASLANADTAVQPDDLAKVATSGAYNDLTGTPSLGTLAAKDTVVEGDIEGTIGVTKISGLGALATKDNITHELITDFDAEVAKIKVTNATNADAATTDAAGNNIADTYATKEEVGALTTDDIDGGEEVWVFYCGNASTDILEATMVPNNAGGTTAII